MVMGKIKSLKSEKLKMEEITITETRKNWNEKNDVKQTAQQPTPSTENIQTANVIQSKSDQFHSLQSSLHAECLLMD